MGKGPGAKTKPEAMNLPWKDAIHQVLSEANGALHYTDIAERIISKGLRQAVGATPASTVAVFLGGSLKEDSSPYIRVGRGVYTLRTVAENNIQDQINIKDDDQIAETGALRAFGMFWQRELVVWSTPARILGKQGPGASDVNFADQIGVYLLHDRDRVIYVGQAQDTLFSRLRVHTTDRLGGRWDRFSWFGLRGVDNDGTLTDSEVPWSQDVVVETMEALLIESLEPPLNRRRGDNLSGIEYIQTTDPRIEVNRRNEILQEMMTRT